MSTFGTQLQNNVAQQAGVHQTVNKQVRSRDAEESRRVETHRDDEEGSSRPGGAREQASAQTAATFNAGDGQKVKQKKRRSQKQVGVGGPSGSRSARRSSEASQSQQGQNADKTEGSRGRYGTGGGNYAAERSHQLATRHQLSQASLTQASVRYESTQRSQGNDANPLSAAGQRRMMLENLSRMVKISLEQHTGGTAGEAYPRRETRQIFSALQGLKAGGQAAGPGETRRTDTRNVTTGEFKLKEQKMNNVLAIFLDPPAPPEGHEPLELVA